jgi:hypothetical protein
MHSYTHMHTHIYKHLKDTELYIVYSTCQQTNIHWILCTLLASKRNTVASGLYAHILSPFMVCYWKVLKPAEISFTVWTFN